MLYILNLTKSTKTETVNALNKSVANIRRIWWMEVLPSGLAKKFLKSLKYTPPFLKMYVYNAHYAYTFDWFCLFFGYLWTFSEVLKFGCFIGLLVVGFSYI